MAINPFATNTSVFPFTDEDLLLFDPTISSASAWANTNFGQGRSVSSIVVDTPTLDSPIMNPFSPTNTTSIHQPSTEGLTSPQQGTQQQQPQQQQQAPLAPTLRRSKTGTKRASNASSENIKKVARSSPAARNPSRHDSTSGTIESTEADDKSNAVNKDNNNITQNKSKGPIDMDTDKLYDNNDNNNNNDDDLQRTSPPAQKRQRRDTDVESEDSSGGRRPSSAGDKSTADRLRLTEQEKKSNHIASEQKRRMAIRWGFDKLTEIVPGLEGQGRSESIVLKKCELFVSSRFTF